MTYESAPKEPEDPTLAGPLKPVADDGLVLVQNPPAAAICLTPDQADISGVRLLDAAERARRLRLDPKAV